MNNKARMNLNRICGEVLLISKSRLFIWALSIFLCLLFYNLFSVSAKMQMEIQGGYYTYSGLAICFIVGIIYPIAIGAFAGGCDDVAMIMEYRLTNQNLIQCIFCKICAIGIINLLSLCAVTALGIISDFRGQTFFGNFIYNIKILGARFALVFFIMLFWSMLGMFIAEFFQSIMMGVVFTSIIFFGERYLSQFGKTTYGIVNCMEGFANLGFSNNDMPFTATQKYYVNSMACGGYLAGVILLCLVGCFLLIKHRYPEK